MVVAAVVVPDVDVVPLVPLAAAFVAPVVALAAL